MKKMISLLLTAALTASMMFGTAVTAAAEEPQETYDLTVAAIDGSLAGVILWVGMEEGIFEKNGVNLELSTFTNGMVMMEAIDTWDLGLTGIGGILAGMIKNDAKLVNVISTDSGTQMIFVRPDSDIVAAGQGNNTLSPNIYGDADTWRGKEILCTQGGVLHYLLMGVLSGFGLTIDDVDVTWMDMATANSSFLSGEGDAACITGSSGAYAPDKANYIVAAYGIECDLGLTTATLANSKSLADETKYAGMQQYMKAYYETVQWMYDNVEAAQTYLVDWCEYCGQTMDEEIAAIYLAADHNYLLDECYDMLHNPSTDGGDYCEYIGKTKKILEFYVDGGSYEESDIEKFVTDTVDTSLIDALHE